MSQGCTRTALIIAAYSLTTAEEPAQVPNNGGVGKGAMLSLHDGMSCDFKEHFTAVTQPYFYQQLLRARGFGEG